MVAACGGDEPEPNEKKAPRIPVVPTVELQSSEVDTPTVIRVQYRFTPQSGYDVDRDFQVLSHFTNDKGDVLFQDDHTPPTPTSAWEPGTDVSYSRAVYVPPQSMDRTVSVRVGLYHAADLSVRYRVGTDEETAEHRPVVAQLDLRQNPVPFSPIEGLDTIYVNGWYQREQDPNTGAEWIWSRGRGEVSLPQPDGDAFLYLRGRVPQQNFDEPATVKVLLNDSQLTEFVPEGDFVVARRLSDELLGSYPRTELAIETTDTFVPAENSETQDDRELGVMLTVLHLQDSVPEGFTDGNVQVDIAGFVDRAEEPQQTSD